MIRAGDHIRAVLARAPKLAAVFERHGLLGCGGPAGPDEPIGEFARLHRVDAALLVDELNRALDQPEAAAPAEAVAHEDRLYRRFVWASLVCTTTLGATFGAINLLAAHWALGAVPPVHKQVHAAFQVLGFLWLMLMGVAYHAVPRFLGARLALPALARASFWLALGGLLARVYGELGPLVPAATALFLVGALAIAGSTVAFAAVLGATFARSRAKREPFQRFLAAGTLQWVLAGAFLVVGAAQAAGRGDVSWAIAWNEPFYLAALLGGAHAWIQGMLLRTGPVFLGLGAPRPRALAAALVLGQAGALAAAVGAALAPPWRGPLVDGGLLAAAASVAAFAVGARLFERRAEAADRGVARAMGLAFASAVLFAALAALYAAIDLATRGEANTLLFDGARHAFALGFVTLAIFGMAGRIIPVFAGVPLRWAAARMLGIYLIAAGVLLRQAEIAAALLADERWLRLSGLSGSVAATGILLAAASLAATLRGRADSCAPRQVPLDGDANVAALLDAHPEALPILIRGGFAPLANPLARRTLARAVSLRTACRMHGVDLARLLAELRAACPHGRAGEVVPIGRLVRH